MRDINDTQFFKVIPEFRREVSEILELVYEALKEKGYDPVNQILCYVRRSNIYYQL